MANRIEKLLKEVDSEIDHIFSKLVPLSTSDRDTYANWLAQTYWYVSHTTRNLSLAAARFPLDRTDMHRLFLRHVSDEEAHEKLAENDLKHLGYKATDYPELPQTSALYQTMYYMIERTNPMAILGYALVLEGLSANRVPEIYPDFVRTHGEKSCSFIKVHCKVDVGHNAETIKVLELCHPHELDAIERGVRMCGELYCSLLDKVQAKATSKVLPFKKAA